VKARHAGGSPAPLTGNDLIIATAYFPNRQGLDHTVFRNGIGKALQLLLIKIPTGLMGIRFYLMKRK
jgi:hypothetical protein